MSSISNHGSTSMPTNIYNRDRSMRIKAEKAAVAMRNIPTVPTAPPTMYHSGITAADLAKFEKMKNYKRELNKTELPFYHRMQRLTAGCTLKPLPSVPTIDHERFCKSPEYFTYYYPFFRKIRDKEKLRRM